MRQGTRLILGKYGVLKDAEPLPIEWTKATPNGDFIASKTVDFLCFDAREGHIRENGTTYMDSGNPLYHLSNIHTFLNSEDDAWYYPMHDGDNAPISDYTDVEGRGAAYADHYGFLRHFEDYELAAILPQTVCVDGRLEVTSRLRLPLSTEIFGENKFNLFKKKAVRAHPSGDLIANKWRQTGINSAEQYMPYFLASSHSIGAVGIVDRTGYITHSTAARGCGIRPVCRIRLDAKVEQVADGVYELLPTGMARFGVTNEEIKEFLGLV